MNQAGKLRSGSAKRTLPGVEQKNSSEALNAAVLMKAVGGLSSAIAEWSHAVELRWRRDFPSEFRFGPLPRNDHRNLIGIAGRARLVPTLSIS